jgi:hypothetical protein
MVSDIIAGIGCILTAVALYRLFEGVSRWAAALMVILGGIVPAVLDCVNTLNDAAALVLAQGGQALQAMLFLRIHEHGFLVNEIFAGLWLFPFGWLVYRSGFMPRFIGVCLFISGCSYFTIAMTGLLAPEYVDRVSRVGMPLFAGEGTVMFWLLVRGARSDADDRKQLSASL